VLVPQVEISMLGGIGRSKEAIGARQLAPAIFERGLVWKPSARVVEARSSARRHGGPRDIDHGAAAGSARVVPGATNRALAEPGRLARECWIVSLFAGQVRHPAARAFPLRGARRDTDIALGQALAPRAQKKNQHVSLCAPNRMSRPLAWDGMDNRFSTARRGLRSETQRGSSHVNENSLDEVVKGIQLGSPNRGVHPISTKSSSLGGASVQSVDGEAGRRRHWVIDKARRTAQPRSPFG